MSLTSTTNRVQYTGDGLTSVYAYSFRIALSSHLLVTVRNTAGVETALTLTTDYTVSGVGASAGGNVTLVDADQAWLNSSGYLTSSYILVIRRVLPLTQTTDIRNQTDFYPEDHENAFDRCVMMHQQQRVGVAAALRLKETDDQTASMTLPLEADRASKYLAFDADGEPIASDGGISSAIPVSSYIETLLDDTTASAAQTTLGISTYVKTILDDTTAAAARTTLGHAPTTTGDLEYSSSATELARLAIGGTGKSLVSTGTAPSWAYPVSTVAKTADYTVLDNDGYTLILVTTSGSNVTITLPTLADNLGREIRLRKVDTGAGALIVDGEGAETIDGLATVQVAFSNEEIHLEANSTGWNYIGQHYQSFNVSAPTIVNGGTSPSGLVKGVRIGRVVVLTAKLTTGGSGSPSNPVEFTAPVPTDFRPTVQCLYQGEVYESTDTTSYMKVATAGTLTFHRVAFINAADVVTSPNWGNGVISHYGASYVIH